MNESSNKLELLNNHLKVKEQNRDTNWDELFFKYISNAEVGLLSLDPQVGPDNWPYLMATTELKNSADLEIESVQKVIHWLSQKGIGLVINPTKEPYPDYVFSYGMIWSFKETGYFIRNDLIENQKSGASEIDIQNQKIYSGEPTLEYLPLYVRKVLTDFLKDQNVFEPKVLMISTDQKIWDLAFSLESLGNPPQQEHGGIAEALSWFLPPHYSIALVSEKNMPAFVNLTRQQIH